MFTVPVLALKIAPLVVSGAIVRFPEMFMVLLLAVKVPPRTLKFVKPSVTPALLVQVPFVVTSAVPPIVVFVPETVVMPPAETLLPLGAVLLVKVRLGLVPSSRKPVPPPLWMAPPRTPAELEVKELVATAPLKLSFSIAPPASVVELFEKVEVPKLNEPVPAV